ncbi:exported hypothetical protein [Crenothrix polyspora]|uniref:Uncharacterized protein n=1 Tax=Crenothrix polyspora TaxID=360316 RepID=A0A1R4H773_9GAMM|nr:hypothetical protein [Crenothrix polyspora]SJM92084.1 exported hypothetical protein [Crenothrix polyspora]
MSRLLPLLITPAAVVLSFSFAGMASAATTYDLMSDCSIPTYQAQKCALSIVLVSDNVTKTSLKKVIFRVNGKPVYAAYNDKIPLLVNTFANFTVVNGIPVTCGKTYTITAYVVKATSDTETNVGEAQPVVCPLKAIF